MIMFDKTARSMYILPNAPPIRRYEIAIMRTHNRFPDSLEHPQRWNWEGTCALNDGRDWQFSDDRHGEARSEGERLEDGFAMIAMGGDG